MTVPSGTLAVVNVEIDLKTAHEGHIYDVESSQASTTEHPNKVLILTIYKVANACATESTCMLINLITDDIHLTKGEMLGFLIETDIELDEIIMIYQGY